MVKLFQSYQASQSFMKAKQRQRSSWMAFPHEYISYGKSCSSHPRHQRSHMNKQPYKFLTVGKLSTETSVFLNPRANHPRDISVRTRGVVLNCLHQSTTSSLLYCIKINITFSVCSALCRQKFMRESLRCHCLY